MATEEKKYLVNVESNLDKYAEDANKAAEEVARLTVQNKALQDSGKASGEEIEKSNAQLRAAKAEYADAKKMVDLQTKANMSNTESRKQMGLILTLEQRRLGSLANQYTINAQGQRVLSAEYIEQAKRAKEAKDAIIEYDRAQSDGRSSVGLYSEAVDKAFGNAKQSIMNMISPMALVAAGTAVAAKVFGQLKEAIMSTTAALDKMNIYGQITKQMFYDIATSGRVSMEQLEKAAAAAELMNEARKGDREDVVAYAVMERELAKLEFAAADRTKTRTEREQSLNAAIAKQNQLSDRKIKDIKDDLIITTELMRLRPKDEKLRDQHAQQLATIIKLDTERFEQAKRNHSRLTGFMKEETDTRSKLIDAWHKEIEADNEAFAKEKERLEKEADAKALADEQKRIQALLAEQKAGFAARKLMAQNNTEELIQVLEEELEAELAATNIGENAKLLLRTQFSEAVRRLRDQDAKEAADSAKRTEDAAQQELAAGFAARMIQHQDDAVLMEAILDEQYSAMLASVDYERAGANQKLLIDAQYSQSKKAFSEARIRQTEMEYQSVADALGAMSNVIGQETAVGKGFAVAQAVINTWVAASQALRDPTMPSTIGRFALAAAAIANGLNTVRNIMKVDPKGGGVSTSGASQIISAPRAPRSFASPVGMNLLTRPQMTQTQLNAAPQQAFPMAELLTAIQSMPPPVVTVEDINARTSAVKKVSVRATI